MLIDILPVLDALNVYRARLVERNQPLKAAAVAHCITIVRRLAGALPDHGGDGGHGQNAAMRSVRISEYWRMATPWRSSRDCSGAGKLWKNGVE